MQIKVIQHVAFEGPGAIADWAHARGHGLSSLYAEDIEPRTASDDFSLLVVMGGPMGVRDVERFPWLLQEAQFIEGVLARKTPILGICTGIAAHKERRTTYHGHCWSTLDVSQ